MLGSIVGCQRAGLPMGSPWGGPLTRLCLVYCDICFYTTLHAHQPRPLSERGRILRISVLGTEVLVLEVRYVDDYHCLWKGPLSLSSPQSVAINNIIQQWLLDRYPLPLKRDVGQCFVGLTLDTASQYALSVSPSLQHMPTYGEFCHPSLMHFTSFVPPSTKRAVVLGLISRIDTYTFPACAKVGVFSEAIRLLSCICGFPVHFLRRCAVERMQSYEWLCEVDWS